MDATETLERPARSGRATAITLVIHNPDGGEKKRVKLSANALALAGAGIVLGYLFLSTVPDELTRWQHRAEAAELRPAMERLAGGGKELASLWLVQNYYKENKERMAALVASENPEAMFVKGWMLRAEGEKDAGMRLITKAAGEGFAPAVRELNRLNGQGNE